MNHDDLAGRILAHAFHDELEKIAGREERKERRALRRGERIISPVVGAGFGGAPLPEAGMPSREERMSRLQAIGEHARTLGEAKGNLTAMNVPQRPQDISYKPVPASAVTQTPVRRSTALPPAQAVAKSQAALSGFRTARADQGMNQAMARGWKPNVG